MATIVVSGPLHWCRCGHGEHEHRGWLIECRVGECGCRNYKRDRGRRRRVDDGSTETPA